MDCGLDFKKILDNVLEMVCGIVVSFGLPINLEELMIPSTVSRMMGAMAIFWKVARSLCGYVVIETDCYFPKDVSLLDKSACRYSGDNTIGRI